MMTPRNLHRALAAAAVVALLPGRRGARTGRRMEALHQAIAGRPNMHAMPFDADSPDGVADFARRVTAERPALTVLVNNAGTMRFEVLDRARDLADVEADDRHHPARPHPADRRPRRASEPSARRGAGQRESGLAFVPLVAMPTYSATKVPCTATRSRFARR